MNTTYVFRDRLPIELRRVVASYVRNEHITVVALQRVYSWWTHKFNTFPHLFVFRSILPVGQIDIHGSDDDISAELCISNFNFCRITTTRPLKSNEARTLRRLPSAVSAYVRRAREEAAYPSSRSTA